MDKQYSNLVKNRNEQIHFNSMCNDPSLEVVVDYGTTGHYITPTTTCTNKQTATQPIPFKMPNGEIITSSHTTLLPQHNLPDKARQAHIFSGLQKPLISIGTLCDNNCIAVFDEKRVTIYEKLTRQIVMQGHRDPNTKLYMINMAAPLRAMKEQKIPDTLRANHVYEKKSKQELTLFYHAACFSPTKRTFVVAIKRNAFESWPGLTVELFNKYLPRTEATINGRIRQQYKGKQSTRMQQEVPIMTQQSPPEILTELTHKVTECCSKI